MSPLVLLYLKAQVKGEGWKRIYLLHFTPMLLVFLSTLDFYSFSAATKISYYNNFANGQFTATVHYLNYILFFIQGIIYTIWAWVVLRTGDLEIKKAYWQKILLGGLFSFSILGLLLIFGVSLGNQQLIKFNANLFILWIVAFLLVLFIRGMQQPRQLFFMSSKMKAQEKDAAAMEQILAYMQAERPYYQADYSIHEMVNALGYSKNYIEITIRQHKNQSFRAFLNSYRIKEAKLKLLEPESQQFTIQAIAEEVGFASLATFYRLFKKHEGVTPKAFVLAQKNKS